MGNVTSYQEAADRAVEQAREFILDGLRRLQPEDCDPDEGVDEFTDAEYEAVTDAVLRVVSDYFMHRDGPGFVVEELSAMREHIARGAPQA